MAQIVENSEGRRLIRLTPDDVLTVVSLYQQALSALTGRDYEQVRGHLAQTLFYLPEDV